MNIIAKNAPIEQPSTHYLIVGVYEDGLTPTAEKLDALNQQKISTLIKQGVFDAKIGQTLPLFALKEHQQIILVGCGKNKPLTPAQFSKIITKSTEALNTLHAESAISYLTDLAVESFDETSILRQIVLNTCDALYAFDQLKAEKKGCHLKELVINIKSEESALSEKIVQQALCIAEGITFAKNLGNLPSNICTPAYLAHEAEKLAQAFASIKTTILGEKDMADLKMGALLGVAQGSDEEAKLICMEYRGNQEAAPVVLVGKGITFDTGGICLKPSDGIVGMKYDMCGGATVFGVIKAAAAMQLPINLVGLVPATENMPSGKAYKPEDILTTMSGQTVEVLNTDAEGRLVLCDALTYSARFKPAAIIDIATLTGAVVVALGTHTTGLLSNNQPLADALLKAGVESNDRAWQLPLFDEYQEQLNSPFADMANVGGKSAGTITAACFLSRFTKDYPWAHLDVAGTAAMMFNAPDRKATGRPIPLLMQYLMNLTHN